jgi:hypothetical protein
MRGSYYRYSIHALSMILSLTCISLSYPVQDIELRADINGDSRMDKIVKVKDVQPAYTLGNSGGCKITTGHYIKYLLFLDGQREPITVFNHKYGTEEADYWQYKLEVLKDLNMDGKSDLIYYAGDDTSQEYVFLLQKPSSFKAIYAGTMDNGIYELNKRHEIVEVDHAKQQAKWKVVGRWNPKKEVFEGLSINWITADCVRMRAAPELNSKPLHLFFQHDIVPVDSSASKQEWKKVKLGDQEGWINARYLSNSSPTKEFK